MRNFIYTILVCLLGCLMALLVFFGIDVSVAQRDYIKLSNNGDYEKKVEGCIFDWTCKYYNNKLWK